MDRSLRADAWPASLSESARAAWCLARSATRAVMPSAKPSTKPSVLPSLMPALLSALLLAVSVAMPRPALAQAASYEIDPEHLSIGFLVDHIGYAKVLGTFREARGSYRFDDKEGILTDMRIEVDTTSVDTNHRKRDEHLRGGDFLDVRKYPKMIFTAASAERQGERDFLIPGELELLGRRQPVTLKARWNKSAVYELGTFNKPWVMGVSVRGSFRRSAFGMMYAVDNGWVGDEVELIIEFEAKRR